MRTITLADPALTEAPTAWTSARTDLTARAGELRDRTTPPPAEELQTPPPGSLADEEPTREDAGPSADEVTTPVGRRSDLDRERSRRAEQRQTEAGHADPEPQPEQTTPEVEQGQAEIEPEQTVPEPAPEQAGPEQKAGQEQVGVGPEAEQRSAEPEAEEVEATPQAEQEPESATSTDNAAEQAAGPGDEPATESAAERSAAPAATEPAAEPGDEPGAGAAPEPAAEPAAEAEQRPVEQRPLLRKERALDPDWIGARPLFRDEAPTRRMPRIEFEPSDGAEPVVPRKAPRIASMRSVVLEPQADPPTLVDPMPPIDPEELVVPDFLRADFVAPATVTKTKVVPRPAPEPAPAAPAPAPAPAAPDPDPPTLIAPPPAPAPVAADGLTVPDFIVPGFSKPAPEPPLRTVLSTVLGPDLWQRCYTEWTPAHCTALARVARNVDGLAPSAGTAVWSTAGAGMRWLGVAREREMLADEVADAIAHPAGATAANQARTVR
ncbi:hypothetical protein KGQ20_45700, partial [Catenulispora sp. NF23]